MGRQMRVSLPLESKFYHKDARCRQYQSRAAGPVFRALLVGIDFYELNRTSAGTFASLSGCVRERAAPSGAKPGRGRHDRAPTGDMHDFDYFAGAWTTRQRRLKARGVGSNEWEEFPATLCMSPYLGGMATVDELVFPTKGWSGLTLRLFDLQKRQWSIYWVSSRTGTLGTPVVGGFEGSRGEFYGGDEDGGHPVKVRYAWTKVDKNHARWEQAFSRDGRAWEVNWTADFTRADPATTCDRGRPR
jgi:hypothetical protein